MKINSQQFKARMREVLTRKTDVLDIALEGLARDLYQDVKRNIRKGYPLFGWQPRSDEYQKWRDTHGYGDTPGLTLDNRLINAVRFDNGGYLTATVDVDLTQTIGKSGNPYPILHELGLGGMPQRAFFQPAFLKTKWAYLRKLAEAFKRG